MIPIRAAGKVPLASYSMLISKVPVMKKFVLIAGFILSTLVAGAQDSLKIEPMPPAAPAQPSPSDAERKEDRLPIEDEELPPNMKTLLDSDEKYKGWEEGTIYFDRSADQFLIHIIRENKTETFRFDKNGTAVTSEKPLDESSSSQ